MGDELAETICGEAGEKQDKEIERRDESPTRRVSDQPFAI
jgi:hypothetical protein